jgi:hypothetical protein
MSSGGKTSWKLPLSLGLAVLLGAFMIPPVASAQQNELAAVRQATARFHRIEAAIEAGYELGYVNGSGVRIITGCIAHPTAGAMGYHYFNKQLIDDLVVDVLRPEGLVYAPGPDGKLKLAAVEYVVPGPHSNPPGVSEPPTVFGMKMHILVPAVGFYIHHAWVWKHNPSGMFADWNPEVACPPISGMALTALGPSEQGADVGFICHVPDRKTSAQG